MTTEEKQEIVEMIKKNLRVIVDTDKHVCTDKPQIVVTILWDGQVIDTDHVTL